MTCGAQREGYCTDRGRRCGVRDADGILYPCHKRGVSEEPGRVQGAMSNIALNMFAFLAVIDNNTVGPGATRYTSSRIA